MKKRALCALLALVLVFGLFPGLSAYAWTGDQLLIPGTAVPVSMVLSGAAAVLSVLAVLLLRKRAEAPSKKE